MGSLEKRRIGHVDKGILFKPVLAHKCCVFSGTGLLVVAVECKIGILIIAHRSLSHVHGIVRRAGAAYVAQADIDGNILLHCLPEGNFAVLAAAGGSKDSERKDQGIKADLHHSLKHCKYLRSQ